MKALFLNKYILIYLLRFTLYTIGYLSSVVLCFMSVFFVIKYNINPEWTIIPMISLTWLFITDVRNNKQFDKERDEVIRQKFEYDKRKREAQWK